MKRFLAALPLVLLPAAALAQTTPVPVTPQACAVTTIATGGTAVTALAGPANGFMIANPTGASETLEFALSGVASTTQGGNTFGLAAGSILRFDGQIAAGVNLSVNAATSAHAFSCARW
ncbi:MAG: hypothetical protein KGL39_56550 [Patescibacteria group bacterium]|nr:hypothetical protein [Patescibacteria group bacterium]